MYLRKSLVAAAVAASSLFSFSAVSAQQADLMITDATVLTMNAAKDVYENGVVVIKGNKILAVGTEELAKKILSEDHIRCGWRYCTARLN